MTVNTRTKGQELIHVHELSSPNIQFDPSTPRWNLQDGQASVVLGLDVTAFRRFRPDRGRKPIGFSIPEADRPITTAEPVFLHSGAVELISWNNELPGGAPFPPRTDLIHRSGSVTYNSSTGTLTGTGAFTTYRLGLDDRVGLSTQETFEGTGKAVSKVLSRDSDDQITIEPNLVPTGPFTTVYIYRQPILHITVTDLAGFSGTVITKSPKLYEQEGPWSSENIGSPVFFNGGRRSLSSGSVESLGAIYQHNDSLVLPPGVSQSIERGKSILHLSRKANLDGILLSNGRKFWLQSNGTTRLVLDLQDDTFLGTRWRVAQIASNRIMVVTSKYAPRTIHITETFDGSKEQDFYLSGLIPPKKPEIEIRQSDGTLLVPSWAMARVSDITGLGGALDPGDYKALVRLVNLVDNLVSEFVPVTAANSIVYPYTFGSADTLTGVLQNDGISVFRITNANLFPGDWGPVMHSRATHIEIWRTQSNGSAFFLETRIPLSDFDGNEVFGGRPEIIGDGDDVSPEVPAEPFSHMATWLVAQAGGILGNNPIRLSDEDTAGLPLLLNEDFSAGGLPPICKDVATLLGVTMCFGRADSNSVFPDIYIRDFFSHGIRFSSPGLDLIHVSVIQPGNQGPTTEVGPFVGYTPQSGDEVVITHGGSDITTDASFPLGVFSIASKINDNTLRLKGPIGVTVNVDNPDDRIRMYIRRKATWKYPRIESDEDVWYSRTDLFGPENFPPRTKILSRNGDTFRRAVNVGNYVAAIMDQGVHLLYLSGTVLLKDTISEFGAGTPWEDSVVVVGQTVMWATGVGINSMTVSNEPNREGHRATIQQFAVQLSKWFKEAVDKNYPIDAGHDPLRKTIRFRRKEAEHKYQSLEFSLLTNRWTLLDDDNGIRYVTSKNAGTTVKPTPTLHSVDGVTGALFELHNPDDDFPFKSNTVQSTLKTFKVTGKSISSKKAAFSPSMVGEIIRFVFADPSKSDVTRTILTATSTKITFDTVGALSPDDIFVIGGVRFRIRFAPVQGSVKYRTKSLYASAVGLRTGSRGSDSGRALVKFYENFQDQPSTVEEVKIGDILSQDDVILSSKVEGSAMELELESLDARNDFDVEMVRMNVRETDNPENI